MPNVPQSCDEPRDPQVLGRQDRNRDRHVRLGVLSLILAAGILASACGKKGNPLPPLRPVPSRIADFTAHRTDDRIELRFTVPSTNADGSLPLALTHIEIYRVVAAPLPAPSAGAAPATPATPGGQATAVLPPSPPSAAPTAGVDTATPLPSVPRPAPPPPTPPVNLTSRNLRATIEVLQPDSVAAADTAAAPSPGAAALPPVKPTAGPQRVEPGARATFVDLIEPGAAVNARWSYVVVGVAGRNRRASPSATLTVPLAGGPTPPDQLTTSNTETTATVSWKGSAPGQSFLVFDVTSKSAPPKALTPAPLSVPEFTEAVEFGQERCFAVRALSVSAGVTVDSALSVRECMTAVDRYPPAAPANLQAIQEGAVITLNWTAVDATDLAGYIVLRGDANGERLEPLMRTPVRGAVFRDTTVQSGGTYMYSVYAVDNAAVPNVSQQSNRQTVTVR